MPFYSAYFLKAIDFSLSEEVGPFVATGGYISPQRAIEIGDPGGETKWGISKASYPTLDIAALDREAAIDIYFRDYWQASGRQRTGCELLPWPLNFVHLDCAINVGNRKIAQDGTPVWHGRANAILQRAAGVDDDGYIGPITLATISAKPPRDIALKAILERELYYRSRGPWADGFRAGWLKRTKRLLTAITLPEAA